MSKVSLAGNASGTGIFTIASPNSNTDRTLTLPDNTGTLLSSGGTGIVTNAMLATGSVTQGKIAEIVSGTTSGTNAVRIPINTAYGISIVRFRAFHNAPSGTGIAAMYLTMQNSDTSLFTSVEWNNYGWYRGTGGIASNTSGTYGKMNQDTYTVDPNILWGGEIIVTQANGFTQRPNITGQIFYTYTAQGAAQTLVNGSHNSSNLVYYIGFDGDTATVDPVIYVQYEVLGVTTT
jgi:hypothetical protein